MIPPPAAPRFDPSVRATLVLAVAVIVIWVLAAHTHRAGWLQRLDFALYDHLMRQHPCKPPDNIVIVAIDAASVKALGSQRLWPRNRYGKVVKALSDAGAAVIAFDILFTSRGDPADDTRFVAALENSAAAPILASAIAGGELRTPYGPLAEAAFYQGLVNIEEGVGGTVRSLPISYKTLGADDGGAQDLFAFGLFSAAVFETVLAERDAIELAADENGWQIGRHRIAHEDFHPAFPRSLAATKRVSFVDVLNGTFAAETFKDKLVFVGTTTDPNDRFNVPTSRRQKLLLGDGVQAETNLELMPGVEFHALTASSLVNETFVRVPPREEISRVLIVMAGVLLALAGARFIPLGARVAILVLAALSWPVAANLMWPRRLFVQTAILPLSALAAILLAVTYEIHLTRLRNRGLRSIFGRYVSEAAMKKILSDPSRLRWSEEREVTVLFCDVRSFTPMAERLKPTETLEVLNTYFEVATAAVLDVGGSVDKFVGDEIMAVFNAPLDTQDHARAALTAAVAILASMDETNRTLAARGLPEIAIGIGIHTGPVVAGSIGAQVRMEYGIIGDTVNTAARLVDKAPPRQILASAETIGRAGDGVIAEPHEPLELKGKSTRVEVYRVLDIKAPDTRA